MPEFYHKQWNNADKQWFTATKAKIIQYMEGQEAQQPSNHGRSAGSGSHNNNSSTNSTQGSLQSRCEGNNGRSSSQHPAKKQRRTPPDPKDECPIHGGHKWKDCFDNRRGSRYCPGRAPN